MEALQGHLDDGEITVGTHVNLSHDAPTVPGSTVTIGVQFAEVNKRTLVFDVEARDEYGVISTGQHQRGVVNRERFESRLATRGEAQGE